MNEQVAREELEINLSDSFETIRKKYRKLAKKYHPDRNPDDLEAAEKCRKVIEAYDFLCEIEKQTKTPEELEMEQRFWEFFMEFWPVPEEFKSPPRESIKGKVSFQLTHKRPYEDFVRERDFYGFVSP
jgi:curved DNA-binding protein CbpA